MFLSGWNELLIAGFSHRSTAVKDGILLATGLHVHRSSAHQAGVGTIFDRVLTELVAKMREMNMDKTELGCLRAIVLFNPGEYFFLSPLSGHDVISSHRRQGIERHHRRGSIKREGLRIPGGILQDALP